MFIFISSQIRPHTEGHWVTPLKGRVTFCDPISVLFAPRYPKGHSDPLVTFCDPTNWSAPDHAASSTIHPLESFLSKPFNFN